MLGDLSSHFSSVPLSTLNAATLYAARTQSTGARLSLPEWLRR